MEIVIFMAGRITAKGKIPTSIKNRLGGLERQSGRSEDIKNTSVMLPLTLTSDRYPCSRWDSNQQFQQPNSRKPTLWPRGHWDRPQSNLGSYISARFTAITNQIWPQVSIFVDTPCLVQASIKQNMVFMGTKILTYSILFAIRNWPQTLSRHAEIGRNT